MLIDDLKLMKPGDVFRTENGFRYLVLENNYKTIKNNICLFDFNCCSYTMFDEDKGNYKESYIKHHLDSKLDDRQVDFHNKIIKHKVDLTTMGGETDLGFTDEYLSPMTIDQFRKYRRILDKYADNYFSDDGFWLCTKHSLSDEDYSQDVMYVYQNGLIFSTSCYCEKDLYAYFEVTFNEI